MFIKYVIEEIKNQISADEVKQKIATDLGLTLKKDKCLCFAHNEKHPSMSFNAKSKSFHCFSCKKDYDIFSHYQEHYNLNFIKAMASIIKDFHLNIEFEPFKTERKPKKKPTSYSEIIETVNKYLNLRGISDKTIKYAGIKADSKGNIVFAYNNELGEHISNKFRPARKVSKGQLKMWFEEGTNVNTLFNMDKINIAEPLVICEGEIDCLALIESGYKNAVSISTGVSSFEWVEVNYSWLEQFREIVLWFDNDEAGRRGIENIAPRIPSDIVKIAKFNHNVKDINELLYRYGTDAVLEELHNAQEPPIENIINPTGVAEYNVYEAEKIKSGIRDLDNMILGFVSGTVNVLTGMNGAGKSTLINEMCVAEPISQGYKTFIYSGELTRSNLLYWITQTVCIEEHLIECSTKDGKKYKKASDKISKHIKKWLDEKLFIYDNDTDNKAMTILNTMEKLAKRKGVKNFVIDNLMCVDLECNTNEELKAQKDFVGDLKKFALKYGAVVHLVAHPRKKADDSCMINKMDVLGSSSITNLCDYSIAVHRYTDEQKAKHGFDSALLLFKNRPTGTQGNGIQMYFSQERKRFYQSQGDLNRDYGYTDIFEGDLIEIENREVIF